MTNRLATQQSAYLLQHAEQPVDWYPRGDEALALATRLDKPTLLSIGYAACHWCHVMARESFSDPAIAALMNEGFVNIKVDREERPDIDAVYQLAHQLLRRSGGGWPLTIFQAPRPRGRPPLRRTGLGEYGLAQTGEPLFRRIVEDTATWALREMQATSGGFHASLAADDAQGREGHFYVWASEPLRLALSPNEWDVCAAHWGLVDAPNFEGGHWHLHVARSAATLAGRLQQPEVPLQALVSGARAKLLMERDKREHPARDSKRLTGWTPPRPRATARPRWLC